MQHFVGHIMFDVDGTLVRSFEFDEECFASAVLEVMGHNIDTNWESYPHVSDQGILMERMQRRGITSQTDDIQNDVKRVFITKIKHYLSKYSASEVPGASNFIETLKQDTSISLLSMIFLTVINCILFSISRSSLTSLVRNLEIGQIRFKFFCVKWFAKVISLPH